MVLVGLVWVLDGFSRFSVLVCFSFLYIKYVLVFYEVKFAQELNWETVIGRRS